MCGWMDSIQANISWLFLVRILCLLSAHVGNCVFSTANLLLFERAAERAWSVWSEENAIYQPAECCAVNTLVKQSSGPTNR